LVQSGDGVVDIGGNRGIYTYCLCRLGAHVEVFEPNPSCAAVLLAWAKGKKNVHVNSVALSDSTGSAYLHIPVDSSIGVEHDSSASLEHDDFKESRDELVPLQTLDSFSFDKVTFIKIDVEGHEFNVLQGAENTFRLFRPALLVEIEQRHSPRPVNEVFELLIKWGYQGYYLYSGEMVPLDCFDLAFDQNMGFLLNEKRRYINNFLFLHQEKIDMGKYEDLLGTKNIK
ncbi:FkbM family methyltransferase, partial [Desulfobulbus sp. US4]|nr:FkbM family methyltransferase [Desulfobulbus sp. US4]